MLTLRRAYAYTLRFAAGHDLGREKPVNPDLLAALLALAR